MAYELPFILAAASVAMAAGTLSLPGIVVLCALTTVLFLGGWHGPYADWLGWLWTLLKTMVLAFVVIWLRVSYPRLREDQLQRFAWIKLVPITLIWILGVAFVKVANA